MKKINELKNFISKNKRSPKSTSKRGTSEQKLYAWITLRRNDLRSGRINTKQIKELYRLGLKNFLNTPKKYIKKESFEDKFEQLEKFYKIYKKWPTSCSKNIQEKKLGMWINYQTSWCRGHLENYPQYSQKKYSKFKSIGYDLFGRKKIKKYDCRNLGKI